MTDKSIERKLPFNLDAEAAVLSAMMIDSHSVSRAIEHIREFHFHKPAHRIIFKSILALFEANEEVDLITIINKLEQSGELDKTGGRAYLNEISDIVYNSANIEFHAKIILEKALLRDLINISNKIINQAYEPDKPAIDIVDWAEQKIFEITAFQNRKSFVKIGEVIDETMNNIIEISEMKSQVLGVSSGFHDLDSIVGGFRNGQFIVIAARPAMGKTSFALNIAAHAAFHRGMSVGIFTLEMSTQELLQRMICSEAEIPMQKIRNGYGINSEDMKTITQVVTAYSNLDLFIDDNGNNTVLDIKAKTRRLKAELKSLDLVIIDYLQLMSARKAGENRQQEISEISRGLKILAKELDVPVMALSQLNRSLEQRDDRRPRLSDLRESGAIEQDADIVMFIYRDDYYKDKDMEKTGISEIIIGKNRHGSVGSVELKFEQKFTKFTNKDDPTKVF